MGKGLFFRAAVVFYASIIFVSGVFADTLLPRQYEVWGGRGPADWAERSVPPEGEGWEEVMPRDNLSMPAVPDEMLARGWVTFARPAFGLVFPVTAPFRGEITESVAAFATPGEYAPVVFSVRALRDIRGMEVEAVELSNESGDRIPRLMFDLRAVRCLPIQARRIDHRYQPEYIGDTDYVVAPGFMERFDRVDIPADRSQQFWLTVKVPEDQPAGNYTGDIVISEGGNSQRLSLRLRVLPFALDTPDPSRMVFSILYNGTDARRGSWGRGLYTRNVPKHFIDMAEHGLNSTGYMHMNPHFSMEDGELVIRFDRPSGVSAYSMEEIMCFYLDAGLTGPVEYQKGPHEQVQYSIRGATGHEMYTPEFDEAFKKITRATVDKVEEEGWPEFVFVIGDEPGGHADRLKQDEHYGKLIKEVAPEVRISNYFNGDWFGTKDWLLLKEFTDICTTNYTSEEIQAEQREVGYEDIWLYNGGSAGSSKYPMKDRIYYGFHPWRVGASGVTQYLYQQVTGDTFNHLDAGSNYLYTYPMSDGPLPTPNWEAVRAGIYDWRYLYTLENLIEKAEGHGSEAARKAAEEAAGEIKRVMANFRPDFQSRAMREILLDTHARELDVYRWRIARQIMRLNELLD